MGGKRFTQLLILSLLFSTTAILACDSMPWRAHRVPSGAMEPAIPRDSLITTERLSEEDLDGLARGEIVTFDPPDADIVYVKRIVGLAGDTVELRDQRLFVNGTAVAEDYGQHPGLRGNATAERMLAMKPTAHVFPPTVVPDGHVFVLGDNWEASSDSRRFGPVPMSSLKARVTSHR